MTDETTARLFTAVAYCICGALVRVHRGAGQREAKRVADEFHARHAAMADIDGSTHRPATRSECEAARRVAGMVRDLKPVTPTGNIHDPESIDRDLPR